MHLAVATPGVSKAAVRAATAATNPVVVKATRCGRLPPTRSPTELTVCVRCCRISLHAADRVLAEIPLPVTDRVRLLDAKGVPRWLRRRFDCPVIAQPRRRQQLHSVAWD
ncbi:hypothetical protein [Halonotius roseus]|uniref:Uncharacterized protein n=1 Tax=Halonotius roseus TaxID=2511997 RepID=A0A544QKK0_9EURY|nr:hypothetical protein [Halonotius roseus]TQQ78902.1 hypothetical protein EWF95_12265 [Halonotius roseus]